MCCISTDGNGTLGPGTEQPLRIDGGEKRSTIIQVTSLNVLLGGGVNKLERKVIPNIAILISITRAGKLLPETSELGRGIFWGRLRINTPGRLANQGEPLLPFSASIGGDKILLFAEKDLIRHILNVAGTMRGQGSVACESRVSTIGLCGYSDGLLGQLARLGIVQGTTGGSRGSKSTSSVVQTVKSLANLRPDTIGTNKDVSVCLGAILESGANSPAISQILKGLDSRLDPDGALGEAIFDQNLLNDGPVNNDGGR